MASNRPSIRNSRFAYAKTVVKRGDSLGSWGRAKKAGELGKKWGKTVSVVGGERKKRASEEKKGGLSR